MRLGGSSWVWQRYGLSIADKTYAHGVTVHGRSSVTIDLNRTLLRLRRDGRRRRPDAGARQGRASPCTPTASGCGGPRLVQGGDPAVPVHVNLAGRKTRTARRGAAHRLRLRDARGLGGVEVHLLVADRGRQTPDGLRFGLGFLTRPKPAPPSWV